MWYQPSLSCLLQSCLCHFLKFTEKRPLQLPLFHMENGSILFWGLPLHSLPCITGGPAVPLLKREKGSYPIFHSTRLYLGYKTGIGCVLRALKEKESTPFSCSQLLSHSFCTSPWREHSKDILKQPLPWPTVNEASSVPPGVIPTSFSVSPTIKPLVWMCHGAPGCWSKTSKDQQCSSSFLLLWVWFRAHFQTLEFWHSWRDEMAQHNSKQVGNNYNTIATRWFSVHAEGFTVIGLRVLVSLQHCDVIWVEPFPALTTLLDSRFRTLACFSTHAMILDATLYLSYS